MDGEVVATCPSCSLRIKVVFEEVRKRACNALFLPLASSYAANSLLNLFGLYFLFL